MIRSTECTKCKWEMVFPDLWIGRSVQCPRCHQVCEVTHALFGQKKDKKRTGLPWRGVKTGLALAAVSSFVFGYMSNKEKPATLPIRDPVIKLRCTSCDAGDKRKREEWETEAFAKAEIPSDPHQEVVFAPEEVPIKCNRCNEEAMYLESRTSPCTQCGHFAPNFKTTLLSKFYRYDGCRHCQGKDAKGI